MFVICIFIVLIYLLFTGGIGILGFFLACAALYVANIALMIVLDIFLDN